MSEERSGAAILIECLKRQGVEFVFGYPGGAVLPIYDELFAEGAADGGIRHILVRHEAGAAHAAEGYARSTGKPGVVLVTSGPGATNAVTGIADAYMDSIPMVVITGQVPTGLIGTDAFQEADTVGLTRHCSKHNYLVKDPAKLRSTVEEAFRIATTGRPGPVVVDIPKDVQIALAEWGEQDSAPLPSHRYQPRMVGAADEIAEAVDMLAAAERPIFYTGGGVINSGAQASALLRELAALTGAPVTSTLMGLGAFPASSDQWLGMLGMHGTYEANWAMNQADLILCVGARFDDRVTGRLDAFAPNSRKIHIDIDRSSINKTVDVDLPVVADVASALDDMIALWKQRGHQRQDLSGWWARIADWRAKRSLKLPPCEGAIAGYDTQPTAFYDERSGEYFLYARRKQVPPNAGACVKDSSKCQFRVRSLRFLRSESLNGDWTAAKDPATGHELVPLEPDAEDNSTHAALPCAKGYCAPTMDY